MTTIWMKPKDYKFYQYPRGVNKGGYSLPRYAQPLVVQVGRIIAY